MAAPPGTGSSTTTQVMSAWASISRRTRTTSPRVQRALSFCSTARDAAGDAVAARRAAPSAAPRPGSAASATACRCPGARPSACPRPRPGQATRPPAGGCPSRRLHRRRRRAGPAVELRHGGAEIRCDSNFAANLSSASEPQRLAVVVSQAPRRCRASVPTTIRGSSSFQAGSSSTARIRRAALASALSISHHQKSLSSVLKRSVVPLRSAGCAGPGSPPRAAWPGRACPATRLRMPSQSITADVGQTFGVRAIEPSIFACARP